jgi:putative transposase
MLAHSMSSRCPIIDAMINTYTYRLLPTKRQHRALESILESQRELYNAGLEERIDAFRKMGITRSYIDQTKALTELRQSDPEFATLSTAIQRATLKRLDNAYRGFFARVRSGLSPGFPRFKGKGWFKSFAFREFVGISLENGRVRFRGMPGTLRIHMHRPLPPDASPRSCVFKRDVTGWRIGIVVRAPDTPIRGGSRVVGVDLGLATFATLSDGKKIPNLRAAFRAERKLRIRQRSVARKRPGSRRRLRARQEVARCHASIARQRTDYLHRVSSRLVRDYDTIVVEDLRVKALARSALSRSVHDAAWAKFISMLKYKAEKAGARVIAVDPQFTTQDCSSCGGYVPKMLGESMHVCHHCGLIMDRDLNAARNILNRAGVGPDLRNVAEQRKRADESLAAVNRAPR